MKSPPDFLTGEHLPPPARQRRSIHKRTQLIKAALDLFAEQGYAATSVDAIAKRANLAVGTFYQHFESKRQLLLALMDQLVGRLAEVRLELAPTADVRAGLQHLLTQAFDRDLEFLGAYRAWQEAILSDADLAKKNAALHAWTRQRVVRVLTVLATARHARAAIDLQGLADILDGLFWSLMAAALQMPARERNRRLETATHLIYHAMFVDSATSVPRSSRRK
jgi:AcrR family transcriptional regulator